MLVLPDIATCPDCLREMLDPADRRHGYPFTNCTNCGPRFSIIQALPYDRPNTTMRRFVLCPACQAEYDSPLDRRFHAQPNACPVVRAAVGGVAVDKTECSGRSVRCRRLMCQVSRAGRERRGLRLAADALRQGQIVAVKGLGGFHLMVDAGNAEAIARLRERKQRYEKPLALMVRDLAAARRLVEVRRAGGGAADLGRGADRAAAAAGRCAGGGQRGAGQPDAGGDAGLYAAASSAAGRGQVGPRRLGRAGHSSGRDCHGIGWWRPAAT